MEIVFIEIPKFIRKFDKLADLEDMERLQYELLEDPYRGDIVKATGGARKIRMRIGRAGKSGGSRVICYFVDLPGEIWLLDIYSKNEKEDLNDLEKRKIFKFIKETIL